MYMRRESRYFFYGISLVLFLIFSSGIQTQGATWDSYASEYEYTQLTKGILYPGGEPHEVTIEDTFKVWNVTTVSDKVYFRTNFTPYFMGLMHFENQEEYDTYLSEHYWYDNDTDSMSLAYSVVGTNFYFVDMLDSTLHYNGTMSDFDIRLIKHHMYGLFLPVNHPSFNFKTVYATSFPIEEPLHDVNFQQKDTFTLDKMRYNGYYLYLEYSYFSTFIRIDYSIELIYSSIGELYFSKITIFMYNEDFEQPVEDYEVTFSLNPEYRFNGTEVTWASSLVILSSLMLVTYAYIRFRRDP